MKAFVVVFYLLQQGPTGYISRMPGTSLTPVYPRWERVVFSYVSFSNEQLCKQWLSDTRVAPPTTVASVVQCEEWR